MEKLIEQLSDWARSAAPADVELLLNDTVRFTCATFFEKIGACEGSLWWRYENRDFLEICYNSGPQADQLVGLVQQPLDEGIVSMVYHTGEAVYTNQVDSNPDHSKQVDLQLKQTTQAMLGVPLYLGEETVGVVSAVILETDSNRSFGFEDLEIMQLLAESLRSNWEWALVRKELDLTTS